MKNILISFLFVILLFLHCQQQEEPKLKEWDIIFQISTSSQAKAIQLATKSKYSHMGILKKINNEFYVYEASSTVAYTPLSKWINRGVKSHYVIKRLKNNITSTDIKKMKEASLSFNGRKYDSYFEWSDTRIYCSELVWKIFKRALNIEIGQLEKFKEFNLSHPIVQVKIKERFNNNPPLEEPVISPKQMFNSSKLKTVISN